MQSLWLSLDLLRHRLAHRLQWNWVKLVRVNDRLALECVHCGKIVPYEVASSASSSGP